LRLLFGKGSGLFVGYAFAFCKNRPESPPGNKGGPASLICRSVLLFAERGNRIADAEAAGAGCLC
jgi:hypothetical protein